MAARIKQKPARTPRKTSAVTSAEPRSRLALPWAALIVIVGVLVYSNSFTGLFVLDERDAIINNPDIRSLAGALVASPNSGFAGRPVISLSFYLNYALAPAEGRNAFTPPPPGYPPEAWRLLYRNLWGYHAVNLAVHILAALLLFGIVRRTFARPRLRDRVGSAATPLAAIIALVFVAHPLQTSAVTYVAQRVESLMSLFYLLTLYCAIRAGEAMFTPARVGSPPRPGAQTPPVLAAPRTSHAGVLWSAAAIVACALGMASKEVMISAPLMVLVYDWLFFARPPAEAGPTPAFAASQLRRGRSARPAPPGLPALPAFLQQRRGFYLGLAATWVFLGFLLVAGGGHPGSVGFNLKGWSPWLYLQTQAGVIVHYLRLAFVPWPLVLDYQWPAATSLVSVLPQGLLLAGMLLATVWALARRHPAGLLGTWFLLILAPSSSVLAIVTEVAAEHRMYLPLAAVIVAVVAGVHELLRRVRIRAVSAIAFGVALGVVALLGVVAHARNADYQDDERIWADTITKWPSNARAQTNYAAVLLGRQRFQEAEAHLRTALALRPDFPEAHLDLGVALCSQGRLDEGIEHFRRAVALQPDYRDAHRNLGEALATLGQDREAVAAFGKARQSAPDDVMLLTKTAWLLATSPQDDARNGREAVSLALRAVQLTGGDDADALEALAAGYAEIGRFEEAIATAERATMAARSHGRTGLLPELDVALNLYRARRPLRATAR